MLDRIRRTAGLAALTLLVALGPTACAAGPGPDQGGDEVERGVIVVDNSSTAYSSLTVYIQGRAGIRERLGSISLNERKRFTFDPTSSEYRLIADAGIEEIVSRSFVFDAGTLVEWDLDRNGLNFRAATEGGG